MTTRPIFAAAAAAIALGLGLSPAMAEPEHMLTISSWGPPTSDINQSMWPQIIEMIEGATDGQVSAQIKYGLAPPPAQYDLIQDGIADMTWTVHAYNPGRFITPKLLELPGYDTDTGTLSAAYWTVYDKHFAQLDEHKGVKLIGLMVHGPGQLASATEVTSLDDFAGMKIRTGGGVAADVLDKLGSSRIQLPAPSSYEAIASNTADATLMTIEGRKSYKLVEVAPYMYEMPGGFYRTSFAIVMNPEAYDSLPADLQAKLDTVFGEQVSRVAGAVWDEADKKGLQATHDTPGNKIITATPEDQAKFREMSKEVQAAVFENIAKSGVDPAAAQADIFEYISSHCSAHDPTKADTHRGPRGRGERAESAGDAGASDPHDDDLLRRDLAVGLQRAHRGVDGAEPHPADGRRLRGPAVGDAAQRPYRGRSAGPVP